MKVNSIFENQMKNGNVMNIANCALRIKLINQSPKYIFQQIWNALVFCKE